MLLKTFAENATKDFVVTHAQIIRPAEPEIFFTFAGAHGPAGKFEGMKSLHFE